MDDYLMPGIPRNIAENPDMETVELIRASITEDSCQVVDSDMLLPCPFCGGDAIAFSEDAGWDHTGTNVYRAYCGCHNEECAIGVELFHSGYDLCDERDDGDTTCSGLMDKAIEAWNRRAERTCHDEAESQQSFLCSECGWFWNDQEDELGFSYCPNCGAKVLGE